MPIRIAIIDDDSQIIAQVTASLSQSDDIVVAATAANKHDGKQLIEAGGYDVLMCDLGLPDGEGADLIEHSATRWPDADILVITVFAAHHKVIEAIKAGARGYLLKDGDLENCAESVREVRRGGSPISPIIARLLLKELQPTPIGETVVLTERETETLNLLARGYTDAECAELLSISAHTVGTYVKNIYRKLEVRSRAEAVFEAATRGMLARR